MVCSFCIHSGERCKPFDLNWIVRGIEEKHRSLLARFPRKAYAGGNNEFNLMFYKPVCQYLPVTHWNNYDKVWHRYHVVINFARFCSGKRFANMQGNFMSK